MKYIFQSIYWLIANAFKLIIWIIIQLFITLWHFNFKNNFSYSSLNVRVSINGDEDMLRWTIIFFTITIISALFGFGGIASQVAGVAKVICFIFFTLFILSLIAQNSITVDD